MKRAIAAGLILTFVAATSSAQVTAVVLEGDAVPGVGNVTRIDTIAINSFGQWSVEADTDFSNSDEDVVVLSGFQASPFSLLFQEGQALVSPAGAILDSFDSITLNDNGNSGYNFFLDPFPIGEDSGVYFNSNLVIQEGTFTLAPEFTAGTPLIGVFDVKINNNDQLLVLGSYDDPAIDSSVDRGLVIVNNPAGAYTETAVLKEGDILDDTPILDFSTGPHDTALSDSGSIMYVADLDSGSSSNDLTIGIDTTVIAREGSPSPIAGRNYDSLSRPVDLNANGDYVFRASLDGDTATDEVIVKNGVVIAQEGVTLPGLSMGSSSGPIHIDAAGNVLWYGEFDDGGGTTEALLLNDQVIAQLGDMVNGLPLTNISGGENGFALSETGGWVIFEGDLEGGLNGAFILQVSLGCEADLDGNGSVGAEDLNILLSDWGMPCQNPPNCNGADFDGDGNVNASDLNVLLSDFGCTS